MYKRQELIRLLQSGVTNDEEQSYGKNANQSWSSDALEEILSTLPETSREQLQKQWPDQYSFSAQQEVPVSGIQLGNIFIGIQPQRGFGIQTQAIYHDPELSPPPAYFLFYAWIREIFNAHAVIHFGKHGNLEWLPGRSAALWREDFPQSALGPVPHLYPFIVNDPGEGTQNLVVDKLTEFLRWNAAVDVWIEHLKEVTELFSLGLLAEGVERLECAFILL